MNWRRLLGLDPAVKSGGVVSVSRLNQGGEIHVDTERLRSSMNAGGGPSIFGGTVGNLRGISFDEIKRQFMNYPPDPRGNPLADKDKKRVHGLHLDDYQPRSFEHGVQRVTFERSYPEQPEWDSEDMWARQRPSTSWVDYRSRNPLHEGQWALPPMRDALADLIEHLHMVHTKLAEQDLVAVEVSVEHEPTPSRMDGSGQGWNFAVHAVAVPQAVLDAEQRKFDEAKAAAEAQKPA